MNKEIKKVSVITSLGAEIFEIGHKDINNKVIYEIKLTHEVYSEKFYDYYSGFSEKGELLFLISLSVPHVVEYEL